MNTLATYYRKALRTLLIPAALFAGTTSAADWSITLDFEDGVTGEKVIGFDDAAGDTKKTEEKKYSGSSSAKLHIKGGADGWGVWGGRKHFPEALGEGDDVWIKISTYVPGLEEPVKSNRFELDTNFALKFLRTLVASSAGAPLGHIDIYLNDEVENEDGKKESTFKYQNENETTNHLVLRSRKTAFKVGETVTGSVSGATGVVTKIKDAREYQPELTEDYHLLVFESINDVDFERWENIVGLDGGEGQLNRVANNSVTNFGGDNPLIRDQWETYVYHIKYSTTDPLIEFYKHTGGIKDPVTEKLVGGEMTLMFRDDSDYTLQSPTDKATTFLLFTYWNGNSPKDQFMYVDDLTISTTKPEIILIQPPSPPQNLAVSDES